MKIKKTFQGELPENRIVNTYSNSLTDAYSANYLNDKLKSVEVSSTEPTNGKDIWVQVGKNLFDKTKIISNLSPTSDGGFTNFSGCYTSYVKVEPGMVYMVSSNVNRPWVFNFAKGIPAVGVVATPWNVANGTAFQVTVPDGFEYISFRHLDTSEGEDNVSQDIQVEQGEFKTDYEPYMPKKIYVKDTHGNYNKIYDESGTQSEIYVGPTKPLSGEKVWIEDSANIFNYDLIQKLYALTQRGSEFDFNGTAYYGEIEYAHDFKVGVPYTLSFKVLQTSMQTVATLLFKYDDDTYEEVNSEPFNSAGVYTVTATPVKPVSHALLRFFRLSNNSTQRTGTVTNIQIEEGTVATAYSAPVNTSIHINRAGGYKKISSSVEVVESGSNENGHWVKYSDGRMECWHRYGISVYIKNKFTIFGATGYYDITQRKNFPQSFKELDFFTTNLEFSQKMYGLYLMTTGTSASLTQTNTSLIISPSLDEEDYVIMSYYAKGRWK